MWEAINVENDGENKILLNGENLFCKRKNMIVENGWGRATMKLIFFEIYGKMLW